MLKRSFFCKQISKQFCACTNPQPQPEENAVLDYIVKPSHLKSHESKIKWFFNQKQHLKSIQRDIPSKYLSLKRKTLSDNLYLIDEKIAKNAVSHILPFLNGNKNQSICETNVGLGFITKELLKNGVDYVRMYETCPDFRYTLRRLNVLYPGKVGLYKKDFFRLFILSYLDKMDRSNYRVSAMLQGVPKKKWSDDPAMSVIGSLNKLNFINYLLKTIACQSDVTKHGRLELFVFLNPKDYIILTATPDMGLHTYKSISVLFQMFFDSTLLEKYPRMAFLPWEGNKTTRYRRYYDKCDRDLMYLVRISAKKELPVRTEHLLPLSVFVEQVYRKGGSTLIPTLENFIPGCGESILLPERPYGNILEDVGIFTRFGELSPKQILHVFNLTVNHPSYEGSPFASLLESQMMKSETIETSLADSEVVIDKDEIMESIEDKF